MTKTAVSRALILALATSVAGVTLMSCTDTAKPQQGAEGSKVGSVGVNLVIAPGVTVNTVSYTISGNGFSKTGTIDVSGTGTTFFSSIGGIPAGNNYTISLSATASDGSVGSGSATFNVTARVETPVAIVLRFLPAQPNTGSILVNGTVNVCPLISLATAVPSSIAAGATTQVTATASDANNAPSPLTYSWVVTPAGIGTLSSATAANPTFTAGSSAGTATLTLTISDGDTVCATLPNNLNTLAIQVTITGGTGAAGSGGGTGGVGTGGTGTGGTAGAGTGGTGTGGTAGAGTGGTGTGGVGTGGTGTGGTAGAGTGGTGTGGTAGAGTGGTGTGGVGTGGTGGTGTGGTGTGGTGTGGTGTGGTGTGGTGTGGTGTGGSGQTACLTCEQQSHLVDDGSGTLVETTSCPDALNGGLGLTGNTPVLTGIAESGQSRAAIFQQLIDCFHTPHNGVICAAINPATGSAQETDCFCGIGVNSGQCFQNSLDQATGPCKNLVVAGAESLTVGTIANRFNDARFAIGAATTLVDSCDQVSCLQCLQ